MSELELLAEQLESEYRPRFEAIGVEIAMWGGIVDGVPFWRTDYGIGVELSLPEPWFHSAGAPYCDFVAETKRPWTHRRRLRSLEVLKERIRRRLDQWLTAPWESSGPHARGAFVDFDDRPGSG